MLSELDVLVGH